MNIRSFGCSFTAGTDLFSADNVWTNIIAERLGWLHMNHAEPAIGNLRIAESVIKHANTGDLCIVNWTWIDRFDFINQESENWTTILPGLNDKSSQFYYRYLHSQYRDLFSNLMHAVVIIDYFERNKINCIMTAIDDLWFDTVDMSLHHSRPVFCLQQRLGQYMHKFNGKNFLDWSRDQQFAISDTLHPLDDAHFAAADLMQPVIETILRRA